MRVVIAPDKFKGSLPALRVAHAIGKGVRRAFPEAEIVTCPLADGGEGTVDALLQAIGGSEAARTVTGPLGAPVEARFALLKDGRAAIEVAAACGIALLREEDRDPLRASSQGVGELLDAALDEGATGAIIGIGGTASSDGGTGAAATFGWRFLDAGGRQIPPGGGGLVELAHIDGYSARRVEIPLAAGYDVTNRLLGQKGAARVFGPQKGASAEQVAVLGAGLERLNERIEADLGLQVSDLPGSGAGGGLGAGIVAFFGGELESGVEMVMDAVGIDELLEGADLVITGEGRLDGQSLAGKAPVGVARRASEAGVRCIAVAGDVELGGEELRAAGLDAAFSVVEHLGREDSFGRPEEAIADTTALILSS
jgi:glycerate 2-kinase